MIISDVLHGAEQNQKEEEGGHETFDKTEKHDSKKCPIWSIMLAIILGLAWVLFECACAVCVHLLDRAVPDWQLNFVR